MGAGLPKSAEVFGAKSLRAAIDAGERAGRPVWSPAGDLVVPRLRQVAVGPLRRGDHAVCEPAEEALNRHGERAFLRREVALYLDSVSDESAALLFESEHAVAQVRHLAAAGIFDVHGWPLTATPGRPLSENVAHHLGYSSRRSASAAVARGRELWRQLAAWPWWPLHTLGHGGASLPDRWWTLAYVVANFEVWRDPLAFRAAQDEVRSAACRAAA